MSSSRKKHIVAEMKKILEQRKAELELNEREIIQHVRYISEETLEQVQCLLKESDKKKFLKAFRDVSTKVDKSLTALMMIKASLPSLESEDSSTDCASDGETAETPTLEERTDDSTTEIEHSATPLLQTVIRNNERPGVVTDTQAMSSNVEAPVSTPSSVSSQQSISPSKESNSSSLSSDTAGPMSTATTVAAKPPQLKQEKILAVPREIVPLTLPLGTKVQVVVSEVVSPYIFWIQPTQSRIETLMEEIRSYYNSVMKLPPFQPKVGMYCCACFTNDDCWYRARIIAIHLSPTSVTEGVGVHVDVVYIDYGNRERIPISRLRPLHPRFMTDCAQAVCCKLARKNWSRSGGTVLQLGSISYTFKHIHASDAGKIIFFWPEESVKPTGKGVNQWSPEETDFFTHVTFGSKLTAIVVRQPGSNSGSYDLPAVDLLFDHFINEKETRLVDVGKLMVSQKRALPDDQCSTTDSYHSHTTHTTDSDAGQSPNAMTDVAQSKTPVITQEQNKEQGQMEMQQEKKESGSSSGKKKKKKKTKRTKRSHDPQISTEDTDVPYEEGRDTRRVTKEESRMESTSDTPVYESEYTTEKREPGLCRTPETSCTELEDKQTRPKSTAERLSAVPMTTVQTTPTGYQDREGKERQDHQMSCGSERSSSPNSTSGVSSARSSTCVSQKNINDPTTPGLISFKGKQSEPLNSTSQTVSSSDKAKDKPTLAELPKEQCKETAVQMAGESDRFTDLTDQFFTCAEDASEADSTDPEVVRSKSDSQPKPPPAVTKVDIIGRRYAPQRTLREGEQIQFAMSHIVSPHEFYIHLITPDAKKMDYLLEDLNSFYSDIETAGVYKPPISWLSIGAICCGKFGEDKRWYRGVVEDIRGVRGVEDGRHVLVKYVDFGNEEWIPESVLYPLEKHFCSLSALAFKCGLARIQPIKTDGMKQMSKESKASSSQWSEECVRSLIGMSEFEKLLTGQVIRLEGKWKKCTWLEVRDNNVGEGVCLNQHLVDLGLVSSSFYKKQRLPEPAHLAGAGDTTSVQNLMLPRPVSLASKHTKCSPQRPEITTSVAKRMVTHALGIKSNFDKEKGDALRQKLKDAKRSQKREKTDKCDCEPANAEPSQIDGPDQAESIDGASAEVTMLQPSASDGEMVIDNWNPMVQHFSSEINSYGVDMDDPLVASTGMKSTIEGRVCKFYAARKQCYKGVTCPFEHPRPGSNLEQTEVFWCNTSVSLPKEDQWVALQVTAVHTSLHFWSQLPFGCKPLDQAQREWTKLHQVPEERKDDGETLTALQDSINAIYQKSYTRREDLSLLALGEIVCAQFSSDDSWYRARVVDVNAEANTVQVFYVDYGNCEWLMRSKVRPAMPQFLHLPFQAVECFLGGVELVRPPASNKQDLDRKLFEELTIDKVLVGHVLSSEADILHVELYDTMSSKHVNIGDSLVNAGFARHCKTHQTTEQPDIKQGKGATPDFRQHCEQRGQRISDKVKTFIQAFTIA